MLQQGDQPVRQQVGGGLETRGEEQPGRRQQLVLGQPVAGLLGRDQRADQVVLRRAPALGGQLGQLPAQRGRRRIRRLEHFGADRLQHL
jgi:hypothetical protein